MPGAAWEAEAARVAGLWISPTLPLAELEDAIRHGLLAFSRAAGTLVIAETMEEECTRVRRPERKHDPTQRAVRTAALPARSSSVAVRRSRAVRVGSGGEIGLDTYEVFS
jgi:hypothetical protein